MAFDGITTACLRAELSERLTGGRIYKIAQTEKDELVLTIKPMMERGGGQCKLYLSADPTLPLAYITQKTRQAPLQAPSFCMLLRKHIQNGRIISITQPSLERVLRFEVEHLNEMGDLCRHTLVIELMGKHSNIIFLDDQERIVDSIKHISAMVSSVREVLPGREYFIPDTRSKRDPLTESKEAFDQLLLTSQVPPASLLVRTYTGLSNLMAEEIAERAGLFNDRSASSLTAEEQLSFWNAFHSLMEDVASAHFSPAIYYRKSGDSAPAPVGYAAVPLSIYADCTKTDYEDMSTLLEAFYAQKNEITRIRQKSADLCHIVQTILERDLHKYDLQRKQMKDTEKRDKYRVYGELLNAFGYNIPEGAKSCELDNYYTGQKITVPLDPTMTPTQNAKKYFDRYTKLKRTYEALSVLTQSVKDEIDHLESIRMALDISTNEGDLALIRKELEDSGLVKTRGKMERGSAKAAKGKNGRSGKGAARTPLSKPLHYISSDGYDIYVGKNNFQNDELTFHFAEPSDIWFHANDMPGSHVILRARGQKMNDIPDRVFEEAAALAAYYSTGREQGKVEIDYLERRNVKKPGSAKPGFVVYYTNYSILAKTDISGFEELKEVTM